MVRPFSEKRSIYAKCCVGNESLHYGHINSLYEYAGLDTTKPIALPKIEHGVNFSESEFTPEVVDFYPNYLFQGDYKKEKIHRINPLKPVFCVGPYIHYATSYYDDEKINDIKRLFGKTLLVFPSHTYESSHHQYDTKRFVDSVVNTYAKDFSTILVCAYWLNINSPLYALFKESGARIVSAGARFDTNFIRRLKTIITLSDKVIGNDIGTHIGYCMYLGKDFTLIPTQITKDDNSTMSLSEKYAYNRNYTLLSNAFFGNGREPRKGLYERFWGGERQLKSPEEMRSLILLANKILEYSHGNISRYKDSIIRMYKELSCSHNPHERLQFEILDSSIDYQGYMRELKLR
jgi:hypothetical protein